MGQQQLLLVILVTIIVGIATVVAINTFSSASEQSNVDATRQGMLSIASASQQYYMKPAMMGGGGNTFDNMEAGDLGGVPGDVNSATEIESENATYTLSSVGGQTFDITAVPKNAGGNIIMSVCPDTVGISDWSSAGSASSPGC